MDPLKFRALARNWEALAATDPLFGVLSDPTKQHGRWEVDEFFESGRAHVEKLIRILRDRGVSFARGRCLDFGCGVGRLTIPLSEIFTATVGVDVSKSMIANARRYVRHDTRCEFVLNADPDLRRFPAGRFDFVHSCLVLQHIPPDVTLRYVAEFMRIAAPGGLAVFQIPADTRSDAEISAMHALPEDAYRARLEVADVPARLAARARTTVSVVVCNEGPVAWRHDIPAGRHICIANHWLLDDGTVAVADDGRARLERTIDAGGCDSVVLSVQAPAIAGRYYLEVDLVQERVCWFAQKGSRTARVAIDIVPSAMGEEPQQAPSVSRRPVSWLARVRHRLRRGTPEFEMHTVPRQDVEAVVRSNGGEVLYAIDDNAAGERWLSYTYICRRSLDLGT